MQAMKQFDLKEAKKYLPYGGMNLIAERTKVLKGDVSRMFSGLETSATERVRNETRAYLTEIHVGLTALLEQS